MVRAEYWITHLDDCYEILQKKWVEKERAEIKGEKMLIDEKSLFFPNWGSYEFFHPQCLLRDKID